MYESLKAGKPVAVEELPSLADALGGGIGLENRHTFDLVHGLVDQTILVNEQQIARSMRHAFRAERLVAEGSGTVGIAALLEGLVEDLGREVAVVISGGNVDMDRVLDVVGGGE